MGGYNYLVTNENHLRARAEIGIRTSQHVDAKIQCDIIIKANTEFYPQHENDQIKWFVLII